MLITNRKRSAWRWKARRVALALVFALSVLMSPNLSAAVTVSFSGTAPASLQTEFIASATNQYVAVISPGFFGDTKLSLSAKRPATPCPPAKCPCDLDKDLALLVATSTMTYVYGFADGMDTERYQDVQEIYGVYSREVIGKTCGGLSADLLTSTATAHNACMQAYMVAVSTINQRWGYIFDAYGRIVNP
jgi:hypothetical protein